MNEAFYRRVARISSRVYVWSIRKCLPKEFWTDPTGGRSNKPRHSGAGASDRVFRKVNVR